MSTSGTLDVQRLASQLEQAHPCQDEQAMRARMEHGRPCPMELHAAVALGQADVVRELLQAGARIDEVDASGRLPLCHALAALSRDLHPHPCARPMVELLLERDVAFRARQARGQDAYSKLAALLKRQHRYPQELGCPCRTCTSVVELRVAESDASRALRSCVGTAALPVAVHASHAVTSTCDIVWVLQLLQTRGALLDGQDTDGLTALHHAARLGRASDARWLLAHGARADVPDWEGLLPLHHAAVAGSADVASLLLDSGKGSSSNRSKGGGAQLLDAHTVRYLSADSLDAQRGPGTAAAVSAAAAAAAVAFAKQGGRRNGNRGGTGGGPSPGGAGGALDPSGLVTSGGFSALALAACHCQAGMVELLLQRGAEFDALNAADCSALAAAADRGAGAICAALRARASGSSGPAAAQLLASSGAAVAALPSGGTQEAGANGGALAEAWRRGVVEQPELPDVPGSGCLRQQHPLSGADTDGAAASDAPSEQQPRLSWAARAASAAARAAAAAATRLSRSGGGGSPAALPSAPRASTLLPAATASAGTPAALVGAAPGEPEAESKKRKGKKAMVLSLEELQAMVLGRPVPGAAAGAVPKPAAGQAHAQAQAATTAASSATATAGQGAVATARGPDAGGLCTSPTPASASALVRLAPGLARELSMDCMVSSCLASSDDTAGSEQLVLGFQGPSFSSCLSSMVLPPGASSAHSPPAVRGAASGQALDLGICAVSPFGSCGHRRYSPQTHDDLLHPGGAPHHDHHEGVGVHLEMSLVHMEGIVAAVVDDGAAGTPRGGGGPKRQPSGLGVLSRAIGPSAADPPALMGGGSGSGTAALSPVGSAATPSAGVKLPVGSAAPLSMRAPRANVWAGGGAPPSSPPLHKDSEVLAGWCCDGSGGSAAGATPPPLGGGEASGSGAALAAAGASSGSEALAMLRPRTCTLADAWRDAGSSSPYCSAPNSLSGADLAAAAAWGDVLRSQQQQAPVVAALAAEATGGWQELASSESSGPPLARRSLGGGPPVPLPLSPGLWSTPSSVAGGAGVQASAGSSSAHTPHTPRLPDLPATLFDHDSDDRLAQSHQEFVAQQAATAEGTSHWPQEHGGGGGAGVGAVISVYLAWSRRGNF
ncbi:hypothetical protein FOA52_014422 [Chlamydomonas sp. UWO 241]|nr:hypothetical protein FOA52_014422 [Chlamydomonas sp. UWO 241]